MARGVRLGDLVDRLRAEVGHSTNPAVGINARDYLVQVLRRTQDRLWEEYDWSFLKVSRDLETRAGQRYYSVPVDLPYDRVIKADFKYGDDWHELRHGIDEQQYSMYDSDRGVRNWPISHWDVAEDQGVIDERGVIEIWPIPSRSVSEWDGQIRITGFRTIQPMLKDEDKCELDATLIVLMAAAEICGRQNQADAQIKAAQAQQLLSRLMNQSSNKKKSVSFTEGPNNGPDWQFRPRNITSVTSMGGGGGGGGFGDPTFLNDLRDVSVETPENGNVLFWNAAEQLWQAGDASGAFVSKSGDTMTGGIIWYQANGETKRMETINNVTTENGLRIYSPNGQNTDILLYSAQGGGSSTGNILMRQAGVYGYYDVQADLYQSRFIMQAQTPLPGTSNRKMVLGNPWPDNGNTGGYNHYQLHFERDEVNDTPFFEAWTYDAALGRNRAQAWIGGDGGAIFTAGVEIHDAEGTDTFSYTFLTTTDTDTFGVQGIGVISPLQTLLQGGGQANAVWHSSELWIQTNPQAGEGVFPGGNPNVRTFRFDEQGVFHAPVGGSFGQQGIKVIDPTDNLNGWHMFSNGYTRSDGHLMNQGIIAPDTPVNDTDTHSDFLIATRDADNDQNTIWFFTHDGDLYCPGDVVLGSEVAEGGSLEMRNIEPPGQGSGRTGWFGMLVTNQGTTQGTLIIQPAVERAFTDGNIGDYYSGEIWLTTSPTSGLSAADGGTFHSWRYKSNGTLELVTTNPQQAVDPEEVIQVEGRSIFLPMRNRLAQIEARLTAAGF